MRKPEAMVKKGELTDESWARIAPLLPEIRRRGVRWRVHREVVNGIFPRCRQCLSPQRHDI